MLLQNQSCDQSTQQKSATTVRKQHAGVSHRFVMTKFDGGVAFDTQTGQICKTWVWEATGKPQKADTSGNVLPRTFGEFSPTCLSLYEKYPSGDDTSLSVDDPGSS